MKKSIDISTDDGVAKAAIFRSDKHPDGTSAPGIILYMDAFGPRPTLDGMAQRLADHGYLVLLPDLFYRYGAYGPFTFASFSDPKERDEIMGMINGTTQAMTRSDTAAFLKVLDDEGASGAVGTVGYCMGGGRALTAAGAFPDRVVAAASFHGGGLATEQEDSPHRMAAKGKARIYVGNAGVDGSFPPEQSARLAEALRVAEIDYIIENYVGAAHGWTIPDRDGVYDERAAERHWKRLLDLFSETLG
ncbi:dienelactone hydrolase family protein [Rhizobium sp. HT1-10]|uniref:dienelactone hydrolase family protein n=1 Tax=Rhizobium sp. HT1-10 TaxID=3111638 RepID=UPI003C24D320